VIAAVKNWVLVQLLYLSICSSCACTAAALAPRGFELLRQAVPNAEVENFPRHLMADTGNRVMQTTPAKPLAKLI
jgi:hypothetical protein